MKTAFRLASLASLALILPALNAHPQPRRLHSRDEDIIYADEYSYIKSYAALGDSYAAGIGVGKLRTESDAYRCSRYDGGYPERIQDTIQAETYKFVACSGDTSKDILEKQFKQLGDGAKFDLITMSAGGNDVGFSDVLKACILIPNGNGPCDSALQKAEATISNDLAASITSLLDKTGEHIADNGFIMWTLYAKFFDEASKPCDDQYWCIGIPGRCNVKLSIGLRQKMNDLVGKANNKIAQALEKWNGRKNRKMAYYAHWSPYAQALGGRLCQANQVDDPKDHVNDNVAFLRPNLADPEHPDLRRSAVDNQTDYELLERDTSPFVPDSLLKYFHPNALGTIYQSGTVLDVLESAFSDLNGISEDGCSIGGSPSHGDPNKEDLRCADVKVSPRAYIKRESMEAHATRFCEETVIKGAGTYQATYDKDVYNGAFIYIKTDHEISVSDCKMHLFQITNGCTPASNNPMNWKYGGELTVGTTLYKINIAGLATLRYTESDGAPLQKPVFYCAQNQADKFLNFNIKGGGFANEDNAQELYRKLQACYGVSIDNWVISQYGQPMDLGREWWGGGHVPGSGNKACLGQVLTQMIGYNANCDPEGVGFTDPW